MNIRGRGICCALPEERLITALIKTLFHLVDSLIQQLPFSRAIIVRACRGMITRNLLIISGLILIIMSHD